jgi:hypothetical protein
MKEQDAIRSQLDREANQKGEEMLKHSQDQHNKGSKARSGGEHAQQHSTAGKLSKAALEDVIRAKLRRKEQSVEGDSSKPRSKEQSVEGESLQRLQGKRHLETYLRHELDSESKGKQKVLSLELKSETSNPQPSTLNPYPSTSLLTLNLYPSP